jgi:hypothetical protein
MFQRLLVLAGTLLLSTALVFAQSDSALLFGLVSDPSGSSIKGAKLHLRNNATGQIREYASDERGLFYFTLLPPGGYSVTVEATGFKQFQDTNIHVQVAQVGRLDVQLEIGSTKEVMSVSEATSTLNSESISSGTVVGGEKISALPLNGRQFIQLALLVPGANPGGRTVQQNTIRQGQIGGLSIAGGRTNNTAFLLDGAANNDPDYNSLNYSPNVDAIAEFQVQTAMVSAEYGRASVNIVSKSGSNEYHGSGWEFLRNKAMDARPFNLSQSELPKYQRNQYGATLGGPVLKEKLFAFLSYEGLGVRQAGSGLTSVSVPTALQRTGDFSRTPGGIFDPNSLANGIRAQFPDNRIPASRINAQSLAAVNTLPLATNSATNFYENSNGILSQNNENYSGRFDYNARPNWSVFGRYSLSDEDAKIPATVPGRDVINVARSQNVVLGSTAVITSNLINETRISYGRLSILNGLPELSFDVNGTKTAIPQFIVAGFPTMGGTGGYNATTGGGVVNVRNNTYQLYDNVSWRRGRHGIKFGGEIYHVQYNRIESPNTLGNYQFTNGFTTRTAKNDGTGDALASMLLGLPQVANRAVGPSRIDGRQWSYSAYIQDDIRLASNVTLNIGLRYELAPPMYDERQQMASIDYSKVPSSQSIFAENKLAFYKPAFFICGQSGYAKGCANTDKNNFAPRVGVVWSANPKTVVKVGSGIFYALNDLNPLFRLAAALPGNITQTVNSDNFIPKFSNFDVFGPAVVSSSLTGLQAAGIDYNQRTSYTIQWNASVQRELAKDLVVEAGYLASLGLKLEQNVQPNNAQPGLGAIDPRRPYAGVVYAPGTQFPSYVSVVGDSVPVGFINFLPHSAQSNYHALLVRFEKRFTKGFSFLNAYTFSKAITNAPQFRNAGGVNGNENSPAQDSFNLAAERGLASFNIAHRWVSTGLYTLPFGKQAQYLPEGLAGRILGGIQLSAIFSMQTGFPFTINLQGDSANVGAGTGGIYIRPNAVPGATAALSGSERSTSRFFNTAAFTQPAAGTFGNAGKNTVIGPGLTNVDLVIAKEIPFRERLRFQIRAEAFNIANHSNYSIVGRIINTPATFGKVLGQLDPRQIQFGAKLIF